MFNVVERPQNKFVDIIAYVGTHFLLKLIILKCNLLKVQNINVVQDLMLHLYLGLLQSAGDSFQNVLC